MAGVRRWALLVSLLLPAVAPARAEDAAVDYFEVGLDYLHKGFYSHARAAFCESLVRAPEQPVPILFLAVAAAAEERSPVECAFLLRFGFGRLPAGKVIRLDLRRQLPSARALAQIETAFTQALRRADTSAERLAALTVLAFLEVHDGTPTTAPALDRLRKDFPADPYARALAAQGAASGSP